MNTPNTGSASTLPSHYDNYIRDWVRYIAGEDSNVSATMIRYVENSDRFDKAPDKEPVFFPSFNEKQYPYENPKSSKVFVEKDNMIIWNSIDRFRIVPLAVLRSSVIAVDARGKELTITTTGGPILIEGEHFWPALRIVWNNLLPK